MRLADEEIRIAVGNTAIFLRPTLRAAMRLERKYKGFDKLFTAIVGGSFTAIADVIEEAGETRDTLIPRALRDMADHGGLASIVTELAPTLVRLVFALAGIDPDDKASSKASDGPPITRADLHTRLFKIATGWLDWTPHTAWSATPAEILTAYAGKIEMLEAIHGTGQKPADAPAPAPEDLDKKIRDTFRLIGTKVVRREPAKAA